MTTKEKTYLVPSASCWQQTKLISYMSQWSFGWHFQLGGRCRVIGTTASVISSLKCHKFAATRLPADTTTTLLIGHQTRASNSKRQKENIQASESPTNKASSTLKLMIGQTLQADILWLFSSYSNSNDWHIMGKQTLKLWDISVY